MMNEMESALKGKDIVSSALRNVAVINVYKFATYIEDNVGAGLIDAMVRPSFNPKTGKTYPEYYVMNDDNYLPPGRKTPPEKPDPDNRVIIYNLKAGAGNDSEIHANFFAQITSGNVDFLANERVVKTKLLATKKGQKMSLYDRREFLLPYEMTSRLMDEINNLKLKPTGVQNQIKVEQISRSMPKDRFSSVEYNLWRIKFYEDASIKKSKKITFFANCSYSIDFSTLSNSNFEINTVTKEVSITIPKIDIFSIDIDESKTIYSDTEVGFLRFGDLKLSSEELSSIYKNLNYLFTEKMNNPDFYEQAILNTEKSLRELLFNLTGEDYNVILKVD